MMQYGFILPGGDLESLISLAGEVEAAGWDAVFYWDGICIPDAGLMYDPWVTLAALARALRYDGLLPAVINADGTPGEVTPAAIRDMAEYIATHREASTPFDIIWEGRSPGDDPAAAAALVQPWADAGVTWWLEARWD